MIPPTTPLTRQVAGRIIELIREGRLQVGDRLVERKVAEDLAVSRSPVRGALAILAERGIVGSDDRRGAKVLRIPDPGDPAGRPPGDLYDRIARDRLSGALDERVTESALLRRYDTGRATLRGVLGRIATEGWIERLPGYGWRFLPTLHTLTGYAESYRFRLAIEPAAILEPGFAPDRPALLARRAEQQALIDGGLAETEHATLFELNSRVHETIAGCSGNALFIDALARVDRLRRLMEYRQRLEPARALVRCHEHIAMIDLILQERFDAASALMRAHLADASAEKIAERPPSTS